jgi:hypothetical protein
MRVVAEVIVNLCYLHWTLEYDMTKLSKVTLTDIIAFSWLLSAMVLF